MSHDEMLWVEKYRPKKVDDVILPEGIAKFAKGVVAKGELPNMTFAGPAGTGKTTLAFALANELGYDTLLVNGSEEGRLFETLRTKIKQFASTVSLSGKRKLVIIDEADYLPIDTVQPALRSFIEQSSNNCSFVLTCNFPHKLMEALRSRCTVENFSIPQEEKLALIKRFLVRSKQILEENNVQVESDKILATFIAKTFPDWRKTLNLLQKYSSSGSIDASVLRSQEQDIEGLVKMIKGKNFNEIRKWVATNPNLDMQSVCRSLYVKMDDYVKNESKPQLVVTLADYQYKHAFVADPEINVMAMLIQLMVDCEWV